MRAQPDLHRQFREARVHRRHHRQRRAGAHRVHLQRRRFIQIPVRRGVNDGAQLSIRPGLPAHDQINSTPPPMALLGICQVLAVELG